MNECLELNNRMSLCKNAKCINTVGSYQCVCLPGFTASDKPNYCVVAATHQTSTHTQWAWMDTRGRQETLKKKKTTHAQACITILVRTFTGYIHSLAKPSTPSPPGLVTASNITPKFQKTLHSWTSAVTRKYIWNSGQCGQMRECTFKCPKIWKAFNLILIFAPNLN